MAPSQALRASSPGGGSLWAEQSPAPTNVNEVWRKIWGLNPLSRARKERAPGIPRGMMRGKSAQSADSSP